jgi:hypothetical protein
VMKAQTQYDTDHAEYLKAAKTNRSFADQAAERHMNQITQEHEKRNAALQAGKTYVPQQHGSTFDYVQRQPEVIESNNIARNLSTAENNAASTLSKMQEAARNDLRNVQLPPLADAIRKAGSGVNRVAMGVLVAPAFGGTVAVHSVSVASVTRPSNSAGGDGQW